MTEQLSTKQAGKVVEKVNEVDKAYGVSEKAMATAAIGIQKAGEIDAQACRDPSATLNNRVFTVSLGVKGNKILSLCITKYLLRRAQ